MYSTTIPSHGDGNFDFFSVSYIVWLKFPSPELSWIIYYLKVHYCILYYKIIHDHDTCKILYLKYPYINDKIRIIQHTL